MWKIWKEELYKIASRKIVWLGVFLLLAFVTFRLFSERDVYTITVDGARFYGQEAIEKDQELTAAYAGELTEETVRKIYERYGFFYINEEDEYEGNFCNRFMTSRFTNFLQTDGNEPEKIHFYEGEAWENNAAPYLEHQIRWDYIYGWDDFSEMLLMLLLVLFTILVIGLSPVFAEEYTLETADLLLTTQRGRKSGIWMKILASMFFAVVLTCAAELYLFVIYLFVYGTQGMNASAVLLNFAGFYGYCPDTVSGLLALMSAMGLAGAVVLSGIVSGISACSRNSFFAVVRSLILLFFPFIWVKVFSTMWIFGITVTKMITHFMVSMPVYLPWGTGFAFSGRDTVLHVVTAVVTGTGCVLLGYYKYRNYQGS